MDNKEKFLLRMEGVKAVITWLKTREEHGYPYPESLDRFLIDLDHSALLNRLCNGKKLHSVPPPVAHSYPKYDWLDNNEGYPKEVWEPSNDSIAHVLKEEYGCDILIIDQEIWKLEEKINDHHWKARYRTNRMSETPQWSESIWEVQSIKDKWHLAKMVE